MFSAISLRISIRTALVATSVVALVCCFGPTLFRRTKFGEPYNSLNKIEWKRSQGTAEGYEFRAPNGVMLSVWTTEHVFADKYSLAETVNCSPDPTRFFVIPPGKWVNTIDEILEIWDNYD